MLAITGFNSRIIQELLHMIPDNEETLRFEAASSPPVADRYIFCHGILRAKATAWQTQAEIAETFLVNAGTTIASCDRILSDNIEARICIIGSESGYSWSFDGIYAASKAAVHRYVETKKLGARQQLVCIAPGIISDCAMTMRRTDRYALDDRMRKHPRGRFLTAKEVALWCHFVLYVDQGYFTNQVVRINGGEHL